jgi:aldehyde dehydrogenase (NAD+)
MAAVAVSPAATDAAGVSSKVSADTKKPVMNGTSSSSASSASSAPAAASAPAPTVAQIFKTLEYGPAPEASDALNAWLDKHNRKFGLFINNQWVFPAGRSLYPSYDPNTGTKIADTLQVSF